MSIRVVTVAEWWSTSPVAATPPCVSIASRTPVPAHVFRRELQRLKRAVEPFAVNEAVGREAGEDAQHLHSQRGRDIGRPFHAVERFPHIRCRTGGEIIAGRAAVRTHIVLREKRFDLPDLLRRCVRLQHIPVIVRNRQLEQMQPHRLREFQLFLQRELAQPPCRVSVLHYFTSRQSSRILNTS